MIKKIITYFALSLFLFLPQTSSAQVTGYMTDEDVINVNCNVSICLSKLSIKKKTFTSSHYYCYTYTSEGDCSILYGGKGVYSTNPMAVLEHTINRLIFLSSGNKTGKTTRYGNCTIDNEYYGNASCDVWGQKYIINSITGVGEWREGYHGRMSSVLHSNPVQCPGNGKYISGKGCFVERFSSNGVTYETKRSPLIGIGDCGLCPMSEQVPVKKEEQPFIGNPVDINSGAKIDSHSDITFPFNLTRKYSSLIGGYGKLGGSWKHNFDKKLILGMDEIDGIEVLVGLTFQQENNDEIYFSRDTEILPFEPLLKDHKGYSVTLSGTDYILNAPNGNKEKYNSKGLLINILQPGGYTYTLSYNNQKQLTQVVDSYGRWLNFIYSDYADIIIQINVSNGDYIQYIYTDGYLSEAKFNNLETISYGYTNGLLTSKIDAKGNLYASYAYDNLRRTTEVKHYAGSNIIVGKHGYVYTQNSVTVTLPDDSVSTYSSNVQNYLNKTSYASIAGGKKSTTIYYIKSGVRN